MTDQYKELRIAASHVPDAPWAKQALQLLDEMDAVGAGGVSGKGSVALEPGVLKPLDNTGVLKSWVSLINQADDETKAILRMGLKEEIGLMFSRSIEVAPEHGDWIEWKGGENPVPGESVQYRLRDGCGSQLGHSSDSLRWNHHGKGGDITSYRVVK